MTTATIEKPKTDWLRADTKGKVGSVDRDKGIIYGAILAEETVFKDKRGEFDPAAIRKVVSLAKDKPSGLKSRFAHPSLSADGLGKFLGRIHDVKSDTVLREAGRDASGKTLTKEVLVARGDIHLDKTAMEPGPDGGKALGVYIMDLAESDPDAFGMSLVLNADKFTRLDSKKRPLVDENGEELPPIWIPTALHACDCVDDGDATHSFLSADLLANLPDAIVRQGCELLDKQFEGKDRQFIESHLSAFVNRYLSHRFGEPEEQPKVEQQEEVPAQSDEALNLELYLMEQE